MFSFLRRFFGSASPRSFEPRSKPIVKPPPPPPTVSVAAVPTLSTDHRARSADEYFPTMARMQAAIAARQYQESSQPAQQSRRQVPSFVRATKRQFGSLDIRSIPAWEVGGTMLALSDDGGGLEEMKSIVESLPDLQDWKERIVQHFDDLR